MDGTGFAKDPLMANDETNIDSAKSFDHLQFPRQDLEEIANLGYGKMGRVFVAKTSPGAEHAYNGLVAVKELDSKEEERRGEFDLEVEMFTLLNHENVVRLIGICTQEVPYYLITEYSEEVS